MLKDIILNEINNFKNRHNAGNGSELDDFDLSSIIDEIFLRERNNSTDSFLAYEYCSETGIEMDEFEENNLDETEDYIEWAKYEIKFKLEEIYNDISNSMDYNGTINIARVMTVDERWLNAFEHHKTRLGIYWSWDHDRAEAHWGQNKSNIIKIFGRVQTKYINWEQTLLANSDFNIGRDEAEITLHPGTPVHVYDVVLNGEYIDDVTNISATPYKA